MLKVYGIVGHTTSIIKFPFNRGKAHLEIEFKHGHIGSGQSDRPARYATKNPAEQHIIENSPYFGALVTLIDTVDTGEEEVKVIPGKNDKKAAPVADTPAVPTVVEHPEITTMAEAKAFLKANKAKATNLVDEAHMKSYMAKIGVSFPNLSW